MFVGYRTKRARDYLDPLPEFNTFRRTLLDQRRKAEQARNLATAVAIRDEEGENLAADRPVRLKAAAFIEGNEGKASVTVNDNQTNNTATISPGYVIRLGKFSQAPKALPPMTDTSPLTIDATLERLDSEAMADLTASDADLL